MDKARMSNIPRHKMEKLHLNIHSVVSYFGSFASESQSRDISEQPDLPQIFPYILTANRGIRRGLFMSPVYMSQTHLHVTSVYN